MLRRLTLTNFKCFADFVVDFDRENVLIGPNNAGKSTVASALRAGAAVLATAARRRASETRDIEGDVLGVYPVREFRLPIELDNVRHEFHAEHLTSVRLEFDNELRATIRWEPGDEPEMGVAYIEVGKGGQPASTRLAKSLISRESMGVLPGLRPLDVRENVLNADYVARNLNGRLAPSHFRNQLALLEQEGLLRDYRRYVERWLPELELVDVEVKFRDNSIDVYYREDGHLREMCWAGDGVQVFMQLLLHVFRSEGTTCLVLDEPEVYLHADLQQRLLGVVADHGGQFITATHSSEIIAAVSPETLAWIDKSRSGAVRLPAGSGATELMESLGSVFNLGLARVLRSKHALFVEGKDLKLLRRLATTLGIANLDTRPDVAVVSLTGSANWHKLQSFDWVASNFLQGAVTGLAVFDRDFHTDQALTELTARLNEADVEVHIWRRHEIENYLLSANAISRLAGCDRDEVEAMLAEVASAMRDDAIALAASALGQEGRTKGLDLKSIYGAARALIDGFWSDEDERIRRLPGKELLSGLNTSLRAGGYKTVSPTKLASELRPEEIDPELAGVLRKAVAEV